MGIPVMILGESGSGKSASLRNFEAGEIGIFNVAGKPLPFRKKLPTVNTSDYNVIKRKMIKSKCKSLVIDDSQYLLAFASFDRARDTGYTKFTDFAIDFKDLIQFVINNLPEDVIVYFLHHTETTDAGRIKAKTIGKMLDNQLTVEGLFAVVLLAEIHDGKHMFTTQSDGYTTCKSPMEMFDMQIENDLKYVDQAIREYYELSKNEENEEKGE